MGKLDGTRGQGQLGDSNKLQTERSSKQTHLCLATQDLCLSPGRLHPYGGDRHAHKIGAEVGLFRRKASYRETARRLGLGEQDEWFSKVSPTARSPEQAKTHDDDLAGCRTLS